MKIFNTFTNKMEIFIPIKNKQVSMYVCGPTVYDEPHLGHARSEVTFDLIRRYLEFKGYNVCYVHNYTDISEKIVKRSSELNIPLKKCAEENIIRYEKMQSELFVKEPTYKPRVTEEINTIISLIKILEKKGFTYIKNGNVFFDSSKIDDTYFNLFLKPDEMDKQREQQDEILLWIKKKEGFPLWNSPWGDGRPGWHIECSAICMKYLGATVDIHGGGIDLKRPHHQFEIIQSESATGKKFSNYWIHNGLLAINNVKVSKSLENQIKIEYIFKKYPTKSLRYYFFRSNYIEKLNFTEDDLKKASDEREKIQSFFIKLKHYKNIANEEEDFKFLLSKINEFYTAMDLNFNTNLAIKHLLELINVFQQKMRENHLISKKCINQFLSFRKDINSFLVIFDEDKKNR
ncbi:cysteine--tRNA ligase [Candidatus Harpocratesius sp.]